MKPMHKFHGGMRLKGHKSESVSRPLRQASLPAQLVLPLKQHIGDYNKPLVKVGDHVLRGDLIGSSESSICASLHAPSSGVISHIEQRPVAHPSGLSDSCIVIELDDKDEAHELPPVDPQQFSAEEMIEVVQRAGIAGLGGAAFPTSAKLMRAKAQPIDTLIINGVECEPYITCDDMLMRNYAAEMARGVGYLQQMLSPKATLIAIEDNKLDAHALVKVALANQNLNNTQVVLVPTIYPSGGEKQLIEVLTGKQIPRGGLSFDIGMLCHNVGTCLAITRALEDQEPLISRIVTLSGDNIREPSNWEVRLGTPISHLIDLAGGTLQPDNHLVMGGPMMGFSLSSDQIPIVKASNCILAMRQQTIAPAPGAHDECIRCGKCTEVCPAQLLPQQLYWHSRAKAYDSAQEFNLFDCIECGCCSAVCPSHIPLVQYYRAAKSEVRSAQQAKYKSDRARLRFEFREQRLLKKKQQEEEKRRLKREALQRKRAAADENQEDLVPDPVQAALERVKARKLARQAANQEGKSD